MNRVDRLFAILTLLQSRKFTPAEKISDKFHISIRTVYRDIKALGESGIPISFEPAKGYFIMQGYFLPPVAFSTEEANALLLLESVAYGFTDKSIQTHYSNALNKVKSILKFSQKEKIESLSDNIRFQLHPGIKYDFDYLSVLQEAISSKFILQISYKNNNEETSKRLVEPIGLVFYAFNWHLIAWCHIRNDYRDFRVSRIIDLKNTETPFKKQDHIELNAYMKQLPVNY